MKVTRCRILSLALCLASAPAGWAQSAAPAPADPRYHAGALLYADDFSHGLKDWRIEMERPGAVTVKDGALDIDVPAGVSLWFNHRLDGPVMISYEATVIVAGGANDHLRDLNSFWMASDPAAPDDLFAHPRTGAFAGYNALHLYYVGLGGNGNTSTRFRRYIGDSVDRPLLPENDLSVAEHPEMGLVANHTQTVTLIAAGSLIQYWRDGVKIFEMNDPAPYTAGWFAIRTTKNHMRIRNLQITRLVADK